MNKKYYIPALLLMAILVAPTALASSSVEGWTHEGIMNYVITLNDVLKIVADTTFDNQDRIEELEEMVDSLKVLHDSEGALDLNTTP